MNEKRPFEGIRVVDLTTYIAAPVAGRMLADWGAEVIKVEPLEGDIWRWYGPNVHVPANDQENPMFDSTNANKQGIALNLRNPKAIEAFKKLLATADIFLTNNREGSLKKMGLDYDSLKEAYPSMIYAQVTGYGEVGPDKDLPGYDTVAHFARTGFTGDFSEANGWLMTAPGGWGDMSCGTTLFGGICAALFARERNGGKGDKVTVSLMGSGIWFGSVGNICTQECYGEPYPKSRDMIDPLLCTYKCKDGRWIMMSLLNFKAQWEPFCDAMGFPDKKNWTKQDTLNKRAEAQAFIGEAFAKLDSKEAVEMLNKISIVQTIVAHFSDNAKDEHAHINDFMRKITLDNGREISMPMNAIKSRNIGDYPYRRGPLLGENTGAVLKTLGYTDAEIAEMQAEKAIGLK